MRNNTRYTIHHVPFLRLLLPLVAGIVCYSIYDNSITIVICGCTALIAGTAAWMTRLDGSSVIHRNLFSVFVFATMMCAGMITYNYHIPRYTIPATDSQTIAIARIEECPTERKYTYNLRATIIALNDSSQNTSTCHIPILLNIHKSYTASALQGGDLILFTPSLQRIESSVIPHTFDYARYMARQGILYRQYLPDDTWQLCSYTLTPSIKQYAQRTQQACIALLRQCNLSEENTALLSALLWGYKGDIPDSMRDYFSASGLSHILAVSGLHTGIIAFLIWLFLYPLRYTELRRLIPLFTMLVLWIYAFITGLSPSVVRACIMASFIAMAALLNRQNTSLNALFGSAVIVLLFSPMQLYDVGFQLSYVAVAGIILLSPYFDIGNYTSIRHPSLQFISGILSVSLAAQLSTTLLAAYYFHYIPLWGIVSNILLVPLLPLLMSLALLLQALFSLGITPSALKAIVEGLSDILINGASAIASLPIGTLEQVWIPLPTLLLYGIIIGAVWYGLSRKKLGTIVVVLAAMVIILAINIYQTLQPGDSKIILSDEQDCATIQLSDDLHHCYIITTDNSGGLPRSGNEWRIKERFDTHFITQGDTISTTNIYIALPFIQYYGSRLVWVDDNIWRYCHTTCPIDIDYAIITEKYNGKISHLTATLNIKNIVLASSLYPSKATRLQEECTNMGITCYNTVPDRIWMIDSQDIER